MSGLLLLLAHGSRDPQWALPIRAIEARLRAARPDLIVKAAFLEYAEPPALEAARVEVARGASRIVIAPLLLGAGTHARRDVLELAASMRDEFRGVEVTVLPIVGELESVLDGIAVAVCAALPAGL